MTSLLQDYLKAYNNWAFFPLLGSVFLCLCACQTPAPESVWTVPYRCGSLLDARQDGSHLLTRCIYNHTLYDLKDGRVLWQEDHAEPIILPSASDEILKYGFGLDGDRIWRIEGESGEFSNQQAIYTSLSSGHQHRLPPTQGLFLFEPSVVDDHIFLADWSGLGLYDLAGDSFVWRQPGLLPRFSPMRLLEAPPYLALWLVHQGQLLILHPQTGAIQHELRLPVLPQGGLLGGFVGGSSGSAYLGVDSTVTAVQLETGQVTWTFTTPGTIHRLLMLPDDNLFICTRDEQLFRLDAFTGEVVTHCKRYVCGSPSPALPVVHPQDGRIALNVNCNAKTGVVVLDPTTLEETSFIPHKSVPTLGPLFWEDLLIHFPSTQLCIRAVRLPSPE